MADPTKRYMASSAMVDLKAELHRKQEEFRRQKSDNEQFVKGRKFEKPKKSLWSQQNRGISERASKDIEQKAEDEDELLKSRRMLAHKSRLYEEMSSTKSIPDDDGSEGFLVDFQKKAVDRIVDEREKQRKTDEEKKEEEAEREALAEPIPEPVSSDEEWVDFTDSLGRSRRCMKKDLNHLKRKDREFSGETKPTVSSIDEGDDSSKEKPRPEYPDLMSSDMHREKMRQKWEDEAQTLLDKGQDDIHYSNVQFEEIRTHGVGFYQFSKDHESREDQLDQLKKLRDQTVSETSRNQRVKDKRKTMMEARLAKVRDRRKLKEVVSDNKKEEENAIAEAAKKAEEEEERKKKEEAEREAAEVRSNHIREWDRDKQKDLLIGKGYVESRRSEREADFAPPSVYFGNTGRNKQNAQSSDQIRMSRLKKSTLSKGMNSEFAPPPSYFNQDNKSSGSQQGGNSISTSSIDSSNTTQVTSWNREIPGSERDSKNMIQGVKKSTTTSNVSERVKDICVSSIPLPAESESCNVETSLSLPQNRSHNSFTETCIEYSDQGQHDNCGIDTSYRNECQLQQNVVQHNWSENQLPHQQHQQQQYVQYQQQLYNQQMQQQTTHEQPLLYQQQHQQGPFYQQHQFHSHNQQQQHQPYQQHQQQEQQQQHQQQQQQHQQQPQPSLSGIPSKRQTTDHSQDKNVVKKTKVPKTSIMDFRFMLNEQTTPSEDSNVTGITSTTEPLKAVPYEPGSFTAARFAHDVNSDDPLADSSGPTARSTQISGGPKLYTKKQQKEQQKHLEERSKQEVEGNDEEADQKLQDFLASIRAETS